MSPARALSRVRPAKAAGEAGQVAVLVALLALLMIALIGIAVDKAFVVSTHQQMQNAADAAALAAVRLVETEIGQGNDYVETRLAAIAVAHANEAAGQWVELAANASNDPAGDIVVGYWDEAAETFAPDTVRPNAVRVRVRRTSSAPEGPLGLVFGPAFGSQSIDLGARATAIVGGEAAPVVLVLDPTGAGALRLNGTALLDASRGLIQVNSSNACAVQLVGSPHVTASKVAATGGVCAAEGLISGQIESGAPALADPLSGLLPDHASWASLAASLDLPLGPQGAITASGSFEPGSYPGGLSLSSQSSVTLQPGVYLLGPPGLVLHGGSSLAGHDVTLLIDAGASVDIRGTADAAWSAPADGQFAGIALFTHRHNTGLAASIGGDGVVSIGGTIYVPMGRLRLAGGPDKTVGSLIVHRLEDAGTPSLNVVGPAAEESEPVTYLVE